MYACVLSRVFSRVLCLRASVMLCVCVRVLRLVCAYDCVSHILPDSEITLVLSQIMVQEIVFQLVALFVLGHILCVNFLAERKQLISNYCPSHPGTRLGELTTVICTTCC